MTFNENIKERKNSSSITTNKLEKILDTFLSNKMKFCCYHEKYTLKWIDIKIDEHLGDG